MENAILRRMNLSSFLMVTRSLIWGCYLKKKPTPNLNIFIFSKQVPVQRVTKYPLLLSRLLKVTPSHHPDRAALQESRERVEHHLEHMNQVGGK